MFAAELLNATYFTSWLHHYLLTIYAKNYRFINSACYPGFRHTKALLRIKQHKASCSLQSS